MLARSAAVRTWMVVLSSGHSFLRAVDCITAVKKDCGLKKPGNHVTFGTAKSDNKDAQQRDAQCQAESSSDRHRAQCCAAGASYSD